MTTPAPQTPDPVVDGTLQPTPAPSEGAGLRAQLEDTLAENRALKAEKRDGIIEGLGLDTATGMGKMLAEKFDDGDLTLDNLETTAINDYGVDKPAVIDEHPQAQTIHQQQATLEKVDGQAGSIPPSDPEGDVRQRAAAGDPEAEMAVGAADLTEMFRQQIPSRPQ